MFKQRLNGSPTIFQASADLGSMSTRGISLVICSSGQYTSGARQVERSAPLDEAGGQRLEDCQFR